MSEFLARSRRILVSRPFSVGGAVDSESAEVDGAGGGWILGNGDRDGPATAAVAMFTHRWASDVVESVYVPLESIATRGERG